MLSFSNQFHLLMAPYRSKSLTNEQQDKLASQLKSTFIKWFKDQTSPIKPGKLYRDLMLCVHPDRPIRDFKINNSVMIEASCLSEINAQLAPSYNLCGIINEAYDSFAKKSIDSLALISYQLHVLIHEIPTHTAHPEYKAFECLWKILFTDPDITQQQFDLLWDLFSDNPDPKRVGELDLTVEEIKSLNSRWMRDNLDWALTHAPIPFSAIPELAKLPYWTISYLIGALKFIGGIDLTKIENLPPSYKKMLFRVPFYLTLASIYFAQSLLYPGCIGVLLMMAIMPLESSLYHLSRISAQQKLPVWSHNLPSWAKAYFNQIIWPVWRTVQSPVSLDYPVAKRRLLQIAYPLRVATAILLALSATASYLTGELISHVTLMIINSYLKLATLTYEAFQRKIDPTEACLQERQLVIFSSRSTTSLLSPQAERSSKITLDF